MASGMQKQIERLISIFQSTIKEKFNVGKYQHRLMMQKLAYILKGKDKSFNYKFNWYTCNPHSPQLTNEEYEYRESETDYMNYRDMQNVRFIRNLIGDVNELNLDLYASILYLMSEHNVNDVEELYFMIHDMKPWFNRDDVRNAFQKITIGL